MKSEDYLQLPEVVVDDIAVTLDLKAQKAYDQMEKDMLLNIDEETIDVGSAAALSNKLLQLCNGAVYDGDRAAHVVHDCKMEVFLETVDALAGKPALVFYSFQHDRDRILQALSKSGLRIRVFKGVQDEDDWNNHKIDILLAHPASTAYGLNLQQGGNHVIWFGLTWSLELYQQANKRLHRQGQTARVIIHRLLVDKGMDGDVAAALESKAGTQEALLTALRARIEKVKQEEKLE